MKQSDTSTKKEPKKIRLKDLITVDYTDDSWPEDEDGQLAYDYWKRASGVLDEKIDWFKLVYGDSTLSIAKKIKATPTEILKKLAKPSPQSAGAQKFQRDFAAKELEFRADGDKNPDGDPKYKEKYGDGYGSLHVKEESSLEEKVSWIDGYIDKYTTLSYNPKDEVLTLTWRHYEKWPKKVKMDKDTWDMLIKSQNRARTFNQLRMNGEIKVIQEDTSLEEAHDAQISKYELNGELKRVNDRIKFLRAAHHGTALPKDVSAELKKLEDKRDSILAMLKEEDILEGVSDEYISEALNMLQRMKRRAIMRRNKSKILAGRRRAQRRRASTSVLQQRAMRAARSALARKLLHKDKGEASYGEKVRVEKMLASRQSTIKRLARKMLSRVRQKEQKRFQQHATPPKPIQSVKPNK